MKPTITALSLLALCLLAGCDTLYRGSVMIAPMNKTDRAVMLFKDFAEKQGYTVKQPIIEKGTTVIRAKKRSAPYLELKVSEDAVAINISKLGAWWAPPSFTKACNDLIELYQKEYGRDKVKLELAE